MKKSSPWRKSMKNMKKWPVNIRNSLIKFETN